VVVVFIGIVVSFFTGLIIVDNAEVFSDIFWHHSLRIG
jgi:hypothetical protein